MKKRIMSLLLVLALALSVCSTAFAAEVNAISAGFTDVSGSAYYADAVQWAVEAGVTSGTTGTTFSPEKACTRAEAVTFLWRSVGSPAPETGVNPFTDVAGSAYYYNAVLWAVEKGITTGTSETTFSPDAPCTRAQIVTFLWRLAGCEAVDAANPFTDVAGDAYYAAPVLWAVAEGVTTGTTRTTFSPDAVCTRAQIVSFLYRYLADAPAEEEEEASVTAPSDPNDAPVPADDTLRLVSGSRALDDEDALVLLIMGDGFTEAEQEDFYARAKETAEYIMSCAPYDEFTDTIKIYALGVVSNESGVTGANASSAAEVANDQVDTYFGASYWSFGMDRLVSLTLEGAQKGYALRDKYLPETDYCLYIVNSTVYGGSGGDYCVASLNTRSYDMMVHEMGHTIGNLADEYYAAGYEGEYVNLTADPDHVPWERFIGKNGIGVYDWGGNPGTGYYIPSLDCKMQYLSNGTTAHELCEVCQEEMRRAICAASDVTKLFFQTYADEFVAGEAPDMREYFILRRGTAELTGDQLGDLLTLTYYDAEGNELPGVPQEAGTYTVKAAFAGNGLYEPCTAEGVYEVVLVGISLRAYSKVEDGTPAELDIDVKYDGEYNYELYFEGYAPNYGTLTNTYYCDNYNGTYTVYRYVYSYDVYDYVIDEEYVTDSEPTEAAEYSVTIYVYDEEWEYLGEKTASYTISTKCSALLNNDSDYYYGATPYANNQNIIIYGEGFTLEEQDEFNALAQQLMDSILATEPFKETRLYFDVVSVNTVSRESGIGSSETGAKDTFFRVTYDAETGKLIPGYAATYSASYLAYSFAGYQGATVVIVNDENATECDTYYSESFDKNGYHMFSTVYVTPNDENWEAYAAQEVLNHLTWEAAGYVPETEEERAQQRLDLIYVMYYEDAEYNACAPIIVSRAYEETFVANGEPVDLYPYFHVYRGYEELPDVNLELYYYDAAGYLLDGAPSEPGEYSVWAVTVPYDPENPDENYWEYYMPEGCTDYDDALWLGMARGFTTFTIVSGD